MTIPMHTERGSAPPSRPTHIPCTDPATKEPLGDVLVDTAADVDAAVARAARDAPQFLLVNERHDDGLGGSIALAAAAVSHVADALLLLLADQPSITAQHLRALIDRWSGADNEIVASAYSGTSGPPVLLPRGTFSALCGLTGDRGAKSVLEDPEFDVTTIPFDDAAVDVDTPADLKQFRD